MTECSEKVVNNSFQWSVLFFSRPRPYLGRLFFHFKYVRSDIDAAPTKLEIGSEVSYIVCREGNRMFAADVVVLEGGTITKESPVEGISLHTIHACVKKICSPTVDSQNRFR